MATIFKQFTNDFIALFLEQEIDYSYYLKSSNNDNQNLLSYIYHVVYTVGSKGVTKVSNSDLIIYNKCVTVYELYEKEIYNTINENEALLSKFNSIKKVIYGCNLDKKLLQLQSCFLELIKQKNYEQLDLLYVDLEKIIEKYK